MLEGGGRRGGGRRRAADRGVVMRRAVSGNRAPRRWVWPGDRGRWRSCSAPGWPASDPATGAVPGDGIEAQTDQALSNAQRRPSRAAGASLDDVVKTTRLLERRRLRPAPATVLLTPASRHDAGRPAALGTGRRCGSSAGLLVSIDAVADRRPDVALGQGCPTVRCTRLDRSGGYVDPRVGSLSELRRGRAVHVSVNRVVVQGMPQR